mgnify:CR=1 FL=1
MRATLLEMVQDILSEMDSDEVNSLDDTIEAGQVATILKNTYFLMCSNRNWGDENELTTLDHVGVIEMPTHMLIPQDIKKLDYLAYENVRRDTGRQEYVKLKYLYPDEFLRIAQNRPAHLDFVQEVTDFGGVRLFIRNNENPRYWTSFDDKHIVCDAYDQTVDTTLKVSKTQAMVVRAPKWEYREDFIPKLPVEAFAALLADAKSTAFFSLKQMENSKAEANAQKQQRWLARQNSTTRGGIRYTTYGRSGRK